MTLMYKSIPQYIVRYSTGSSKVRSDADLYHPPCMLAMFLFDGIGDGHGRGPSTLGLAPASAVRAAANPPSVR